MGNIDEPPVVKADPKDWFKKLERPPTLDLEWNECKTVNSKPTQKWLSDLAKAEKSSKTFDDLMSTLIDFSVFAMNRLQISDLIQDILVGPAYKLLKGTCRSYVKLEYNMEECYKALNDQPDWNNPEGGSTDRTYMTYLTKMKADKYDLQGIKDMNRLFNLKGEDIVHLVAALRMFTRRIVIQKRVEDLQVGVESYQKKLNISRPLTHKAGITDLEPYTTYSNPQGVIYLDMLNNLEMLISVQDKLKDMLNKLEMGYTSVMQRRRWRNLDKKWSRVMVKDINHQLLERRLMRSLEKFVGGREYGRP
ncbi:hypothetical protein Tco_1113585 [Tanacetum coccineum]|uniref:Uncharacterized protein n=1 Tax=Tanacetum coccineum TaxID=301880 RepID=A0ABQ5ISN8_9ASTR